MLNGANISEPVHPLSQMPMLNKLRSFKAGEPPKVLSLQKQEITTKRQTTQMQYFFYLPLNSRIISILHQISHCSVKGVIRQSTKQVFNHKNLKDNKTVHL